MERETKALTDDVAAYYTAKLEEHGPTARGVDWNGAAGQRRRFVELSRILDVEDGFSVFDLGCGYGAYFDFLSEHHKNFHYTGYDVSPAMIEAARDRLAGENVRLAVCGTPYIPADFGVASGIFNVRMGRTDEHWWNYIFATLDAMHANTRRGFAFNCLTSWSDPDLMRDTLYYADPTAVFEHCIRRYDRNVALLHDYGHYEFTMLVRKVF